jgi:hypothetical protein
VLERVRSSLALRSFSIPALPLPAAEPVRNIVLFTRSIFSITLPVGHASTLWK